MNIVSVDGEIIKLDEAARRLGVSPSTVYDWVGSRWLLAHEGMVIPAEQIVGHGEIVPGIRQVLEILLSPRSAWRFLTEESPFFDEPIRPIDALKAGRVEDVVLAARSTGEAFT